ncbi:MAG: DNA alkylation repair protein [Ruminococcaceae bacterium]|nr:DNA alkylation repair protein [Oscillospiraceae bacterium]
MNEDVKRLRAELISYADEGYRLFQSRLMPSVDKKRVIGVRMPILRRLAIACEPVLASPAFGCDLPHPTYEEDNLHALWINGLKEYDTCLRALEDFLPFVDNWATCDLLCPRALTSRPQDFESAIRRWIASGETYTVRFGIGMLMRFFLDERFDPSYPKLVAAVRSEEYYVRMMAAWYFATALAKRYEAILPYAEKGLPDPTVHRMMIRKAIESDRITPEQKAYLKTLKGRAEKPNPRTV